MDKITVLEHSRISPAPYVSIGDKSFLLSCLDIPWLLPGRPLHLVFFYELQHSKSHLFQTTIPNLKHSLSVTLQHFFPLAGHLIVFPFNDSSSIPTKPEIRYMEGDSISFTVAESKGDFVYFIGSHARKAHEFYPLVPKLGGNSKDSDNYKQAPLLAVQVTIFPTHGICIGITSHHAAGDGSAIMNFLGAWASITKFGNDKPFLATGSLPVFDKSFIKDPNGMDTMIWNHVAKTWSHESSPVKDSGENGKVRGSFIITKDQINQVKKSILARRPTLARVSSFSIVCAHVWTCLAKVRDAIGEQKGTDEREHFGCVADCRAHLDPPIPTTYFGNCVVPLHASAKRDQLFGEEGFFNAVELIGDAILAQLKNMKSIETCSGIWMQDFRLLPTTSSLIRVAGSPKYDIYHAMDFGWGKPKKCDMVSAYNSRAMCLTASRESKEDIEISLSLTKNQMDVFETIFTNELEIIMSNPLILSKI